MLKKRSKELLGQLVITGLLVLIFLVILSFFGSSDNFGSTGFGLRYQRKLVLLFNVAQQLTANSLQQAAYSKLETGFIQPCNKSFCSSNNFRSRLLIHTFGENAIMALQFLFQHKGKKGKAVSVYEPPLFQGLPHRYLVTTNSAA